MEFYLPALWFAMERYPEIRDLILEHKEVFTVHDDYVHFKCAEECHGCDYCNICEEYFPKKDHLHPDYSKSITDGFSKHSCANTHALKLTSEERCSNRTHGQLKGLFKTKISQALLSHCPGETSAHSEHLFMLKDQIPDFRI